MTDYAEQYADDTGALHDVPEYLQRYIDFEAWGRDMEYEMSVIERNGSVFIFDA